MKLYEICAKLDMSKDAKLLFKLPSGDLIPEHFHVTEIQSITKNVFYCNQTTSVEESTNFQLWVYTDEDHRITAKKLLNIISKSNFMTDKDVYIEHDEITLGRYAIDNIESKEGYLIFKLEKVRATCADPAYCLREKKANEASCCAGKGCC